MRINSIDFLRLLSSFLVVCIHSWTYWGRDIVVPLARIAVPLFFLISGFFLYSKDLNVVKQRITVRISKVLTIWLLGTLLYIVDQYFNCSSRGNFDLLIPSWKTFCLLIFFCHQRIAFHLWFLVAMAEGLIAMYLSSVKQWDRTLKGYLPVIVPCLLITVGVILNKYVCYYFPIIPGKDLQYPPVLFMSWPFLQLGYVIHKYQERVEMFLRNRVLWGYLMIVLLMLATTCEGYYAPTCGDNYFATLPLVLTLFSLLLIHPMDSNSFLASCGRKYSLGIYVLHVLVYRLLYLVIHDRGHWLLHPFTVFSITFVVVVLFDKGCQKLSIAH